MRPNRRRSLTAKEINPIRELKERGALGLGTLPPSLTSKHPTLTPSLTQVCSNHFECRNTETNTQISQKPLEVEVLTSATPPTLQCGCLVKESSLCTHGNIGPGKGPCERHRVSSRRGGGVGRMKAQLSWERKRNSA